MEKDLDKLLAKKECANWSYCKVCNASTCAYFIECVLPLRKEK